MCRVASISLILLSISRQVTSSQCSKNSEIDSKTCSSEQDTSTDDHECSLYMAPSSISGAGFGMFTTRDVLKGEDILPYSDAPSVVMCDLDYYGIEDADWAHPEYYWNGDGLVSFECIQTSESVVSFGALANYHPARHNVEGYVQDYDDTAADRFSDPGAGAFSYYQGHHYKASKSIAACDEIFTDYGSHWLDLRKDTFADTVPRLGDFKDAASIMDIMKEKISISEVDMNDSVLSLIKGIVGLFNERASSLIPETKSTYEALMKNKEGDFLSAMSKTTVQTRDVKWIRENGLCLDTISPGKSTLPQAGQGAFATRFIPMGSIVSPVPLLQIMNSDRMRIYDDVEVKLGLNEGSVPSGTQMLINYCFGHKESKLLLCPQSNANLINHCSNRQVGDGQCGDKGPNAKVQWASGWDPDTPSWLEMSLEEMRTATMNKSRGLSMEIVATRDIKAGEEIFIDYGPTWEEAWELHKKTWKPPAEGSNFQDYIPIKAMTELGFRNVEELEENPYPKNVVTACYWYEFEEEEEYEHDEEGYYNGEKYINEKGGTHVSFDVWECDLLEIFDDGTGDIRIPAHGNLEEDVLLTKYPMESVIFRTREYTSDQHLPDAFRHFIGIEESMFPNQWKKSDQMGGTNFGSY